MTNTQLLKEAITKSGLKIKYIVQQLGLTYAGFNKKLNNRSEFNSKEIVILRDLLCLTAEEVERIFLLGKVTDSKHQEADA